LTDTRTPADRQRIMRAVRRRDTTPEILLRRALFAAGVRGWRCDYRRAPGRPDLAWPALRVAVFVDGAFWHGHPSRHRPGRSGRYWDDKIAANMTRDRRVDSELRSRGWTVVRVWDFEVQKQRAKSVEAVADVLRSSIASAKSQPKWIAQVRVEEPTSDAKTRYRRTMWDRRQDANPEGGAGS
jgi:DNA mismatch endonuclease (patch repair protein)